MSSKDCSVAVATDGSVCKLFARRHLQNCNSSFDSVGLFSSELGSIAVIGFGNFGNGVLTTDSFLRSGGGRFSLAWPFECGSHAFTTLLLFHPMWTTSRSRFTLHIATRTPSTRNLREPLCIASQTEKVAPGTDSLGHELTTAGRAEASNCRISAGHGRVIMGASEARDCRPLSS